MRSVFRFLSYSLLYIIIAVASAYGVITISMSNYTRELNASNNSGGGSQEIVIPEEISSMFEKITSSPALGLELEVGVQAGETNIDILVDGEVDLSAGVDNLAVAADIAILLNGSPINLDLTYQNGNLYLEMLNNKFFIATDNLLSSVDQIMTLLNVEMPELGIDLDSLSLDTIMGFFANYEESVNEDGSLTLSVALPVGDNINLELITTSDYTLTGIGLEPISIEGTSIEAQGQLHYLVESSIPTLDSEDYIDLTNVIDLACGVINYVNQDNFALELNFKYQDVVLNGDILFSLNDKKALVKLNIEEYAVNLLYIDNNIYLEFNNIFVKFDLSQTNQLFELLSKYFDIDIPSQLISSIFGAIESGDFSEVIDSAGLADFDLTQFDFSSIDLGILNSIEKNGNITTISIEEIGDILVTIDQGSLSQIAFDGFGIEADLSVIDYYEYSLSQNQGDYADISLLLPTIDNVLGLLQNNTYSGVISAKIGDFNLDINYLIHHGESKFITLSTTLLGQDIKATIIDGKIYVEISDSKIVATLDNLGNVINQLVSTFSDSQAVDGNDESQLIDVDSILDSLLEIINPDVNPKLITKFTTTENGVAITLLDKYNITLSNFSNQLDVAFNYDSIDVKINVIGSEQNIVAPSFNDEEYTPIEDIANTIINVYNYVLDGKFYISLNASYKDLVVSGGINYDESGLSATITLTYKNLTANVIFYENSLYVTAENIKLVFNLDDIDYVKAFLNDYFGLDIESMLQELLSGEQNSDVTEDGKTSESVEEASDNKLLDMLSGLLGGKSIEEIIAEAKLSISSDNISLTALDGLQVDILLSGNMIDQLTIKYQDISASASINKEPISIGVNASEYYNIIDLVDIVKGGVDLARQKQIGLSYNVTYNEIALSGNIYLDLESKSAKIVVNYKDITANVILIDNVLYLEAYNLYAKFGLSDIGNVTLLIEKYFGVDMPDELIAKLVSVIESGDLSQLLESIDTSSVDLSSIDLSVVEGIVKVEDKTIISLADIGDITISMTEGKLNSVGFVGFDITANISTSTYQTISLYSPIESYIDIADLLPTLDNILAILQNNTFSGKISLVYGDYSFDVDYIIHTGDNSFVTLSTTIFDQSIVINIIENKVYIDISESKIVCDLDNIGNVIDKILAKFMPEQEAPSFDLKEELDKLLDVNNNPLLITSFVKSENGISLAILDKIFVSLGNGDKSLTIDANYQNIDISASLKASEETLARPEIVGHYTQIENIIDTVINVYDYVASKTFYVSFNASYQDIALVGGVNYDESGLSATITLTYKNLTANVIFYENSLYVTAENIKLVFNLDDIDYVKAFLNDYFGLDIESMLQELLSGEQNSDVTEDGKTSESVEEASDNKLLDMLSGLLGGKSIEEIIAEAKLSISSDNISLTALDGLQVDILLSGNMIDQLTIKYQDISASASINKEPISIGVNASEYYNIIDLVDIVKGGVDLARQKQIGLSYNVTYNEIALSGNIYLDLESKSAKIVVNYKDITANVILIDNVLYLEAYNLYAKFGLSDIGNVTLLIEKYFGVDMPDELIAKLVSVIESGDLSQLLESIDTSSVDLSSIDLSVVEGIVKVEDKTIISLADIGDITISMTEGKLNSVGFVGFDITANISTSTYQTISLYSPIESYIDIADLLPTLDNILAILQNNTFSGKISLVYGDYSFDVDYIIHTGDNSFVTLSTTIFDQSIVINIIENKVYIDISESKIVCDLDNIGNVIDKILAKFMPEQEAPSFDLKEELDKLLDVNNNPLLITSFVKSENGISLAILDKIFVSLGNGDKSLTIDANYQNIDISASLKASEETLARPEIVGHYTQIENIVDTVINVYDYVANKTFYVSFNASYQDIVLAGGVNYDESGLSATVTLTYKNLTANVILYQNSLYITAENIKLVFDLDDIDYVKAFLNDYFGLDVESMLQELLSGSKPSEDVANEETQDVANETSPDSGLLDMLSGLLGGKSIEEIVAGASFKITDNIISLTALDGLKIDISLENNMISTAYVEYALKTDSDNSATENEPASQSKIVLNATIEDSPLVFNPVGEFTDVAGILNYVELFMQYVETKKLELGVDLNIDDDNITGALQLDLTSTLMMSASLTSNTIENFDININIEKDETGKQMLYVDYSGLCLKIDNSNFNEILYILLEVLGIDTTKIPFLSEIDLDLNFSQIDTDIASIDLSIEDIINMLKMVKSIKDENNALVITLDGGAIFGNESAEDLVISLHKEGGKINKLVIANCYLNSELSSKIGATITFNEITEFKHVDTSKNYIDISGSNELIKAIVNMSNDTDFHVHGSLNIVGNLAGIEIKWNVPFDIYIKAVAKGKVEIYGVIGEIPTMVGVNNDVPYKFDDTESGSNRYLYFYYQDDYIYLYRSETIGQFFGSGRTYEKCTKVSVDTFFGDIMYYVQYCFGFTDTIMNAIIESMNNPRTEPMDMSNIITSFVVQDNTNFAVELNMHELTNNPDLDKLSLTLGLRQDSEGKNYIGGMTVALNMPLADIFTLYLTSDDITLVDYGKEVDMSPLYDFINNYKYPNESEWEASDGEWNMVSETLYTINFESNSEQTISSQTYHYKDALELPVLSDYVVDDGKTNTYYHFVSWHTSEDLSDESVFNSTTMPRGDITLYAKWTTNTTTYYTIDFVTNSDQSVNPITKLEGEEITLPSFTTKEETDENTTSYYEFGGWYTTSNFDEGSEFTESVMPSKNVTLYAKWNLVKTEYTRSLNIYDGDQLLTTLRVKAGDVIDLSTLSNVSDTTKFYYEKEFKNQMVDFTMPDNDLNIYIRNMYKVTFTSLYGNISPVTYSLYQGESITKLPAQSSYVYDDGTQTVQTTYTFNGYNVTTNVMPNHDVTFEADWTVTEKKYYTITFDILDNDVSLHISPWKGNAKLYYNGVETSTMSYRFLEGQVDLNAFVARCKYRAVLYYYYIFQGWKGADENGYYNLTGDVTIEASFSSLQSGKDGYDRN